MTGTDDDFDPYRVLGLPVGADEEAIQRRYRDLVRKHHPDVSSDSEKAHQRFVRIQRAYQTLMDPTERARWERKLGFGGPSASRLTVEPPAARFDECLSAGRALLRQRRLREAREVVAEAIELNPFSAEAYRLLGDIYMAGGNTQMGLELYREAELLQGRPEPPPSRPAPPVEPRVPPTPPPVAIRLPVLATGVLGAGACLVVMTLTSFAADPGRFAGFGCGAAFLLAAGAVASGLMEPVDELLGLADVRAPGRAAVPGALYLLVLSAISPYAGVAFYVLLAALTEAHSKGLLKAYAITFAVGLAAWLAAGGGATFALVAPSIAFIAALIGWLAGSFVAPGEWWRR